MAPIDEPPVGPSWSDRAQLPTLAAVLDPGDLLGAKNRLIDRAQKRALRRAIGDVHGKRVLDFGCGTGRIAGWLTALGADVLGVDPSPAMIDAARRAFPGTAFEVISSPHDLPTEAFDVVVTVYVLQYPIRNAAGAERLLTEVAGALRHGGRLVSIEQTHDGSLPVGAPIAEYLSAFAAAGLRPQATRPVRAGASRLVRLVERRPQVERLPFLSAILAWEARRSDPHDTPSIAYLDTLFETMRER